MKVAQEEATLTRTEWIRNTAFAGGQVAGSVIRLPMEVQWACMSLSMAEVLGVQSAEHPAGGKAPPAARGLPQHLACFQGWDANSRISQTDSEFSLKTAALRCIPRLVAYSVALLGSGLT